MSKNSDILYIWTYLFGFDPEMLCRVWASIATFYIFEPICSVLILDCPVEYEQVLHHFKYLNLFVLFWSGISLLSMSKYKVTFLYIWTYLYCSDLELPCRVWASIATFYIFEPICSVLIRNCPVECEQVKQHFIYLNLFVLFWSGIAL